MDPSDVSSNILSSALEKNTKFAVCSAVEMLKIKYPALLITYTFQDKEGDTALHCAVYGNWHMAVRPLVFAGANPSLENSRQLSPLHLACAIGFTAYVSNVLVCYLHVCTSLLFTEL